MAPRLPRNVRALGLVSLLNDASSEMIYPLLPSFLVRTLGAGPAFLGVIEGLAEAAASALKLASGWVSDRLPRRKPLVVAGYGLSALVRSLIAVAVAPLHVLAIRVADRVGKGVRGAPRDALLAEATPSELRGRAFGFHRAMDHAGAMVGPLLASALLALGLELRTVFWLAAVPAGLGVLALVLLVREAPRTARVAETAGRRDDPARLGRPFALYLAVLAVFALGNSADAFLLLRAQEAGVAVTVLPLVWAGHHLVKSATSTHLGALSDRLGRRPAIVTGFAVYALAYAGFAFATTGPEIFALFALYGLHHAFCEGPERALVADLVSPESRGRAFGLFHAVSGGMLLPASVLTGALWQGFGATAALLVGAALSGLAAVGLLLVPLRAGE